ncbi:MULTISPECIES: DUF6286 domain-containing protein [Streptomyces]|uniref:DUF6286 domain-containing protein n=1 Tax=Streptomyces clavifer TaxID=68188 RepID=A0ABS4VDX4_9ACTN|nr:MULTISPECIES: DUF6286 domain-containing protein [Streptomyces]MBP2362118.1 hypothetical protein [Streptomyces clavifer]MDX2747962.1 DUF6286 domain-containing protein [Streptomyces sp. NRRL_B-2557]RPK74371.1 hypothetical protein EES45_27430 [Streptomyces sp. ADI97-07]WUC27140.1 DUF6286 domain-containing protein [Streptomyces clavifer]GHB29228.1 hypothetical protein GCM10010392_66790 [Streptomyces clavifer]
MSEPHDPRDSTQRLPAAEPAPAGDVRTRDASASGSSPRPGPVKPPGGRAGRFWSGRRVPAALVALVVLGGAGLLLYDVAAVRADHPAMEWRRSLADDLASRHLDDVWVLAGSAAAAAIGLWLLLLALTPGLRAVLPMRREHAGVRAGLDRTAAALVLRDRAVEVAGVQSVRVKTGRRKATVRAVSHFRELDDVRADLATALGTGIEELGLAKPPGLSVHVRRPAKKG